MIYNFYDTSALLKKKFDISTENIIISSITLSELENIKNDISKDLELKYAARHLLYYLRENQEKYQVIIFKPKFLEYTNSLGLTQVNNDIRILSCAIYYDSEIHPDEVNFITDDLSMAVQANLYFGQDSIILSSNKYEDEYSGYLEINMSDKEMEYFYSNMDKNIYNLLLNQYLIINDNDENFVDAVCWTGIIHEHLNFKTFNSMHMGVVKPFKDDIYQRLAADSLYRNQITMLTGPAGSGKSYLSLGYLFELLEKHKIDKIVVFCNPLAVKNAARLGFLPGDKNDKILDSQIGNILSSKLGGRIEVDRLVQEEKLVLIPFSDLRGYDTTGMSAGVYITEAQNLDIDLMKLALQRIGEDSVCVIDGDLKTQVDNPSFEGDNNGMRRLSEVFRGQDFYGEIKLNKIHRSKIAMIAENM